MTNKSEVVMMEVVVIHSLEIYRFACEATFSGVRAKKKERERLGLKVLVLESMQLSSPCLGLLHPVSMNSHVYGACV